jgi:3-oxoacyl-[acyl-carrier protein] reductase
MGGAMADGFSRVSGRVGVVAAQNGPAATLLVPPLAEALKASVPVVALVQEARHGRIVLIGSLAARTVPKIAGASYVAAKSALVGLARSILSEYSPHGITLNTICPGRIISEMSGPPDTPGNRAALTRIPIGRVGEPQDIARVVEFPVRPESDFINGAIIDVNGGEFTPA